MSARVLTDGQVVLRSMRARPLSTWVTVAMVATGVGLLLVLLGMRSSARTAFDRGSGNVHLLVSSDPSPLVAVLNGIFYANAPAKPVGDSGLGQLTAGDTVARFRAADAGPDADEVRITASNCACVFAPRFAAGLSARRCVRRTRYRAAPAFVAGIAG